MERELFGLPGVGSGSPAATSSRIVRASLEEFTGIIRVTEGFILLLALLMAYNAASINADERGGERAMLFAFGLPVRRVLWLEIAEGLMFGLLGTMVGLGLGMGINRQLATSVLPSTLPDMSMDVTVSAGMVIMTVVLGVIAAGVAPLPTLGRLRRMDVPGTLRGSNSRAGPGPRRGSSPPPHTRGSPLRRQPPSVQSKGWSAKYSMTTAQS